jgi:hypothetical protein
MRIPAREASAAMNANSSGVFRRRLTDEHVLDIYLVSDRFKGSIALEVAKLPADIRLPDIELGDVLDVVLVAELGTLKIDLLVEAFSDVFYVLVDDLIDATVKAHGAEAGGVALIHRLRRWERLLEASSHGLSRSAQKGLFGELFVLKEISKELGISRAVESWFGPEAGVRDFEINRIGIEVKTTSAKGALSVKISSERQLELVAIVQLFLWCVSIEKVAEGLSLNATVKEIREIIGDNVLIMELFDKKLMQVGYVDADNQRYQSKYAVRDEYVYRIDEKFPAITSEKLDHNLYDVSYRIMLEGCAEWNIHKNLLFQEMENE